MNKLILALSALVLVAGCSGAKDPLAPYKGESSTKLFNEAEQNLAKGNYNTAANQLEALDNLYPFGSHAEQGQLDIIYAYYMDDDLSEALAAAQRFIHLYPRSEHVDYAYYMKGLITFKQGMTWLQRALGVDPIDRDLSHLEESYAGFNELVERYPNSIYAPDAILHMAYIRNAIARAELSVGQYYFYHHAYVAAVNRSNYVIEHFQGTPAVTKALMMNVQSYHALQLDELARQYLTILELSYPKARGLKKLKRLDLTQH